jgi:hypothetical protein
MLHLLRKLAITQGIHVRNDDELHSGMLSDEALHALVVRTAQHVASYEQPLMWKNWRRKPRLLQGSV